MKQKGQGIVEFALVVPMLAALGIAIVYVGIMFLDYTQYSNAARDAARDISIQTHYIDSSTDVSTKTRAAAAMRHCHILMENGYELIRLERDSGKRARAVLAQKLKEDNDGEIEARI